MIKIRSLSIEDIPIISAAISKIGWHKPAALYHHYFAEQENNQRCVWLAWKENNFAGYVTLKWHSDYPSFALQNLPEINDLNVLPQFRNLGIGSRLLDLAEAEACKRSSSVGLGVGLSVDYGNAQKLYVKRGYIPDGHGITYKNKQLSYGDMVQLDDDLVLWLVKKLNSKEYI